MSLREFAREFKSPRYRGLTEVPKVLEAKRNLERRFEEYGGVAVVDAALLRKKLADPEVITFPDRIPFREWKLAPWVLFSGEQRLADNPGFLSVLFLQYRNRQRRSAYQNLILAYLRDYQPDHSATLQIAAELKKVCLHYEWPWKQRSEEFQIFDPGVAEKKIADTCLTDFRNPHEVLASLGMGGARLSGGLAMEAWRTALSKVQQVLTEGSGNLSIVERILEWSVLDGKLLYRPQRADLATALLTPWINVSAPEHIKSLLLPFFLEHFRDPRLPANVRGWIGVPEPAVAVMRKWLTAVALHQFLEVVDHVAHEHMWRYRRAFWLAYHAAGYVDDAWVLFGPEAQFYAERAFGRIQSYGKLRRSTNVQANHSVLLMRIGKLTIADWSHSGKCHIWLDGNESRPSLYLATYGRSDVTKNSDNDGQPHHGSEYGTWQRKIADYIRMHTGIRINSRDYMP